MDISLALGGGGSRGYAHVGVLVVYWLTVSESVRSPVRVREV